MGCSLPGVKNPNARFSSEEVTRIRRLWRAGRSTAVDLGRRFGVREQTILGIVHGKTYRHFLARKVDTKNRLTKKGERHNQHKLTNRQVRSIKKLLAADALSLTEIGRRYGVSRHQIARIRDGRNWRHIA